MVRFGLDCLRVCAGLLPVSSLDPRLLDSEMSRFYLPRVFLIGPTSVVEIVGEWESPRLPSE